MYTLSEYGSMIADAVRFPAYARAIEQAVRPGDVVADIGSGTGILAFLACKAGARRVYAIEPADAISLARTLAAANGFAEHIVFLQADSRGVQLPEHANVVVSDVRGSLPLFRRSVAIVNDARERFLASGGRMIPQRDTIFAAAVESEPAFERVAGPWRKSDGLDLSSAQPLVLNNLYVERFESGQLLSEPHAWCCLDYCGGASPRVSAAFSLKAKRPGTVHGLALWFDSQLYEDTGFSGAPGMPHTIYSHVFLPWLEPLAVQAGEALDIKLSADPAGDTYIWRWETARHASAGRPDARFVQSNFFGAEFMPGALRKHAAEFVPQLSKAGAAQRALLERMDGRKSLEEISRDAAQQFPELFSSWEDAFRQAVAAAVKFAR